MRYYLALVALILFAAPAQGQQEQVLGQLLENLGENEGFALHPRFLVPLRGSDIPARGGKAEDFRGSLPADLLRSLPSAVDLCELTPEGVCELLPGSRIVALAEPVSSGKQELEIGVSDIVHLQDGTVAGRYYLFRFKRHQGEWTLAERTLYESFIGARGGSEQLYPEVTVRRSGGGLNLASAVLLDRRWASFRLRDGHRAWPASQT